MSEFKINGFNDCLKCGECCANTPCDLIPADLSLLLDKFNMSLQDFFQEYLIGLIIGSSKMPDVILMMMPVKVDKNGHRIKKYLADLEYCRDTPGQCIFLDKNKVCSIHDCKPHGGDFLLCQKMTNGPENIQLKKEQYFIYWYHNQYLFDDIFPGFQDIFDQLNQIYKKKYIIGIEANKLSQKFKQSSSSYTTQDEQRYQQLEYEFRQHEKTETALITNQVFPLFNGREPVDGYYPLIDH